MSPNNYGRCQSNCRIGGHNLRNRVRPQLRLQLRQKPTLSTQYSLSAVGNHQKIQNLFKLDTAATIHVTGDFSRFQTFVQSEHPIKHGDTESTIQGFGSVVIPVETTKGMKNIQITNVAYVPNFYFNIISAGALEEKGVYINTLLGWLVNTDGEKQYKIHRLGRLYALEKAHPEAAVFASKLTGSQ